MKRFMILALAILISGTALMAQDVTIFLKNGKFFTSKIVNMNKRGVFTFEDKENSRVSRRKIWMMNFQNKQFDIPEEREKIHYRKDTLFLVDDNKVDATITVFDPDAQQFSFKNGGFIHTSRIKRIYFGGEKLPQAYKDMIE